MPEAPRAAPSPHIEEIAAALAAPDAWPGADAAPGHVQTHLSHVFLVGDRVYKLRKDVDLGFVDFHTRALRNADCLNELRLNRRLSPSVYLGVAPVEPTPRGPRVGALADSLADPALEHVVVMRRLPEGADALTQLRAGTLDAEPLESVAGSIAAFHASHRIDPPDEATWLAHVFAPMRANFDSLRTAPPELVDPARLAALERRFERAMERAAPSLAERRQEGRVVDGHGDLHLEHVWLLPGEAPVLIDCIEFSDDLRRVDAASEVAFLAMDLRFRRRPDLAGAFLSAYASASDDYGLFEVVDLFQAYRSMVRAKVAALAAGQESVPPEQRAHERERVGRRLQLTESLLEPRAPGRLVVLCGTVGSGKSRVGRALARAGAGIAVVADRVRKHEAGLAATDRSGAQQGVDAGLYTPERRDAVYAGLLERAARVVASGRNAVLDAGYASRRHRDAVRRFAQERGVGAVLVEVHCDPERARRRLERRAAQGKAASDAGPELLATSLARYEPPDEWPPGDHLVVESPDAGEPDISEIATHLE